MLYQYSFQDKSEPFNQPDAPEGENTDGESLPETDGWGDPLRKKPIDDVELPLPPKPDSSISPN